MFALKRNQVIITALVIMIAVAGYLNYTDTGKDEQDNAIILDDGGVVTSFGDNTDSLVSQESYEGEIGEALTMDDNPMIFTEDSDIAALPSGDMQKTEPGEAVFVSKTVDLTYFVEAKMQREQARAKQKDILLEMINNSSIEESKRAECAEAMLEIQKRIEKETATEAMIETKGFKEVYVRIDDNTVDIVVDKEVLTDAEIAQIEDIVKRKTGIDAKNIRISPMKR